MDKKIASKEFIEGWLTYLAIAFPKNEENFWGLLAERLQCYGCSELEVSKAVYSIIDYTNKEFLTIAEILQPILIARELNIVD
ncbi:hypothetical protein [uncultured Dysgonomonas sp.]|uniref:Uncharacterized protein n=1 Tax=uncultured Dysgonomonas sp. TaxID=206096 RepID=A0A212K1S6_9BACT|nr:hypothetical protein [uncultured Dysgonomonas sp.]SBW05623.1 hypothetical protein KL86DYS1_31159 [uncultured Dysgonomonas sp.]